MRILSLAFLLSSLFSFAQTVTDITTKQVGDKIEIHYEINESSSDQKFTVTISCMINNTEKIVLSSVTGDVGPNVAGGKSAYVATWDVLKDVDALNSAEFFVKIENQNGKKPKPAVAVERPWYIMYNGGLGYTPGGIRLGYAKDWGGFIGFRIGSGYYVLDPNADDFEGGDYYETNLISLTAGVSKQLVNNNDFIMNGYLGGGIGIWGTYDYYVNEGAYVANYYGDDDEGFEFEYGLQASYQRFAFSLGLAHLSGESFSTDFVIGLGLKL